MNIFNSLGSNYDGKFALQMLFARNNAAARSRLISYLEHRYSGKAILLYKGREAIELALRMLNVPQGTVVAVNGFTCYAVYKAVKNAGCTIEYLDISEGILHFSPDILKTKLKERSTIKVLLIQNTLGYPCDIEGIAKICREHNIILIEDIAHSIGARYTNDQEAGTIGDFTVLSFSQDKMIDAVSGGALIIRNKQLQNTHAIQFKNVSLKQQMIDRLYPLCTFIIRTTYRWNIGKIIHAALKKVHVLSQPIYNKAGEGFHILPHWYCNTIYRQFQILETNLHHRKRIASIYVNNIHPQILSNEIMRLIPFSSNLRFPLFIQNRNSLIRYLKGYGIHVSDIWYDAPIAPKKYMNRTDYKNQCPHAEKLSDQILNLPTHKNISEKLAKQIAQKINIWLQLP